MKLNLASITGENEIWWHERGFILPKFNVDTMREKTIAAPVWIHFGCGNIFRAFPAISQQKLLDMGISDKGIVAVSGMSAETVDRAYTPYDDLSVAVTLCVDGRIEKRIVASVAKALVLNQSRSLDFDYLRSAFSSESLQLVTVTITEKGYKTLDIDGKLLAAVAGDIKNGPKNCCTYMGMVAALCYERYLAGQKPLAIVSMDNFSHNGDRLRDAILTFANGWETEGLVKKGFAAYLTDTEKVSFPWTMIDKITPMPAKEIEQKLRELGIENAERVENARGTYIAPFVNAEAPEYLVIEDSFPAGRPPLEESGIIFTDRKTVDLTEKMKVCTCLNPLHTALAIFGCLLSYTKISEEMKNPLLKRLVYRLGFDEGMPVAANPGIIKPEAFLKEVLEERIPNSFLPDTPQRIATDTSQKIPIRFGETLKAYIADENKDTNDLTVIPLVIAGWLRYLMAVDDNGNRFEPSPDPLYNELKRYFSDISVGHTDGCEKALEQILSNEQLFGVNLCEIGIASKIIRYFKEMSQDYGAVKRTLEKYVAV